MTIQKIKTLTPILKIANWCKRAGVNPVNIQQKISRHSELTQSEAMKLQAELENIIKLMQRS
tara:strand:- start:363 stop:548 length:186 start_codon:yes stop_codon:yes gene_type:complete